MYVHGKIILLQIPWCFAKYPIFLKVYLKEDRVLRIRKDMQISVHVCMCVRTVVSEFLVLSAHCTLPSFTWSSVRPMASMDDYTIDWNSFETPAFHYCYHMSDHNLQCAIGLKSLKRLYITVAMQIEVHTCACVCIYVPNVLAAIHTDSRALAFHRGTAEHNCHYYVYKYALYRAIQNFSYKTKSTFWMYALHSFILSVLIFSILCMPS